MLDIDVILAVVYAVFSIAYRSGYRGILSALMAVGSALALIVVVKATLGP